MIFDRVRPKKLSQASEGNFSCTDKPCKGGLFSPVAVPSDDVELHHLLTSAGFFVVFSELKPVRV
jgi:hypothetical protein